MGKYPTAARVLSVLLLVPLVLVIVPGANSSHASQIPCTDTFLGATACPDLIVEPAKLNVQLRQTQTFGTNSCDVQHGHTQPGTRQLIRFYFSTPNIGTGDLIVGAPRDRPDWFVWDPCHGHYHMREYADYRMWTPEGYAQWAAVRAANPDALSADLLAANPHLLDKFVASNKMGFCVIDIFPYVPTGPPQYGSCSNNQGITVGWADEYVPGLPGQWIDVTGVAPGLYILEAEVNSERLYVESDYTNNASIAPMVVLPPV